MLKSDADWNYSFVQLEGENKVSITLADVVIKFKDGKIAAFSFGGTDAEHGVTYANQYSFTYGGQEVTLPEVSE